MIKHNKIKQAHRYGLVYYTLDVNDIVNIKVNPMISSDRAKALRDSFVKDNTPLLVTETGVKPVGHSLDSNTFYGYFRVRNMLTNKDIPCEFIQRNGAGSSVPFSDNYVLISSKDSIESLRV